MISVSYAGYVQYFGTKQDWTWIRVLPIAFHSIHEEEFESTNYLFKFSLKIRSVFGWFFNNWYQIIGSNINSVNHLSLAKIW